MRLLRCAFHLAYTKERGKRKKNRDGEESEERSVFETSDDLVIFSSALMVTTFIQGCKKIYPVFIVISVFSHFSIYCHFSISHFSIYCEMQYLQYSLSSCQDADELPQSPWSKH